MKVVIIDGQGGRVGQLLVESIKKEELKVVLYAIGTNSIATSNMLKSGADYGATGENPVVVNCQDADVIIGPIGILAADSLLGEITEKMALTIGKSKAVKLLLPISHCNNQVVGVKSMSLNAVISETIEELKKLCDI